LENDRPDEQKEGEYRGELTSSLSLEGRQLGQPIRQLGQLMPVAKIMASIPV
jgi:hypothetical protein